MTIYTGIKEMMRIIFVLLIAYLSAIPPFSTKMIS